MNTESSGSTEGLLGSVTTKAGGVATVIVPMDRTRSASGPPGSLSADAYHSQSLPNAPGGTQLPLLRTMAPQSDPRAGMQALPPLGLSALHSLPFFSSQTGRSLPGSSQPAPGGPAIPAPTQDTFLEPLKQHGVPSPLCSTHHLLVYRPHALMGPWVPWRPGQQLSWRPPKVLAQHRAGTQKR